MAAEFFVYFYLQLNQVSPQQTDVIEHHYKVYERLQKVKAETEEVSANKGKHKLVRIPSSKRLTICLFTKHG